MARDVLPWSERKAAPEHTTAAAAPSETGEHIGKVGRAEGHHARVADTDQPLRWAGVLLLADGQECPCGVGHEPAIAGWIRRLEAEDRHAGALIEGLAQADDGGRRDERGIRVEDDDIAAMLFERGPRCQDGMSRAQLLGLNK